MLREQIRVADVAFQHLHERFKLLEKENGDLKADNKELAYLLRQILYARGPLGTKFIDELDRWHVEDLEQRFAVAVNYQLLPAEPLPVPPAEPPPPAPQAPPASPR